jgi:hypothetical protein
MGGVTMMRRFFSVLGVIAVLTDVSPAHAQ